jgi:hypothetical protein
MSRQALPRQVRLRRAEIADAGPCVRYTAPQAGLSQVRQQDGRLGQCSGMTPEAHYCCGCESIRSGRRMLMLRPFGIGGGCDETQSLRGGLSWCRSRWGHGHERRRWQQFDEDAGQQTLEHQTGYCRSGVCAPFVLNIPECAGKEAEVRSRAGLGCASAHKRQLCHVDHLRTYSCVPGGESLLPGGLASRRAELDDHREMDLRREQKEKDSSPQHALARRHRGQTRQVAMAGLAREKRHWPGPASSHLSPG